MADVILIYPNVILCLVLEKPIPNTEKSSLFQILEGKTRRRKTLWNKDDTNLIHDP